MEDSVANKTAQRAAASKKQQALRQRAAAARRRTMWTRVAVAALVVAVVVVVIFAATGGGGSSTSTGSTSANPTPQGTLPTLALKSDGTALATGQPLATTPPPWNLPADAKPYIKAAGLTALPAETLNYHYHAHLDVIDGSSRVTLPQGLGFVIEDGQPEGLTSLHTHDTSGIVHIESPKNTKFTLGQVFTEWAVRLSKDCVGGLCSGNGKVVRFFVDGKEYTGDPQQLVLRGHQEIAIWYGPATAKPNVPGSYPFPDGY
ncbi:MAG TPA: hypothetical protein VIC35_10815 [Acidimicrobiia bacterium]|jgi:hypothetical protein